VLNQAMGDYLRKEDSYDLHFFFSSMMTCSSEAWVRELIPAYRPDWVFGLLLGARKLPLCETQRTELERLCARVLRGYQYKTPAYPLVPHKSPPTAGSLPVLPNDDSDLRMAVLLPDEIARWFELCDVILEQNPRFPIPADWFEPDDGEMNEAVRNILKSLDVMRTLDFGDMRMVSFIG